MEILVYNNSCIEEHSLYRRCPSTLKAISDCDYPRADYCFDPNIECFDADTYEHSCKYKKRLDKTVDAVIGVTTYKNNAETHPRLMLVELRMGFNNVCNLSATKMLEKVDYTRQLMGSATELDPKSLFVFNDSFAPQAKSWFERVSRTKAKLNDCKPIRVSDFGSIIHSPDRLPYTPIHSEKEIRNDLEPHLCEAGITGFFKQTRYWCKTATSYESKNCAEFQSIKKVVADVWAAFEKQNLTLSEEDLLEKECLEEDYTFLLLH